MLHQVIFSGNIKKGNSPIISQDDAQRVCGHAAECDYTGFTVYIDGNYITLYEGNKDNIQKSIDYYANSKRYSKIITMLSRPVSQRDFPDFKLGLRKIDCKNVFGKVEHCFLLTPECFAAILPKSFPQDYKTLLRTFARVNNMAVLESRV